MSIEAKAGIAIAVIAVVAVAVAVAVAFALPKEEEGAQSASLSRQQSASARGSAGVEKKSSESSAETAAAQSVVEEDELGRETTAPEKTDGANAQSNGGTGGASSQGASNARSAGSANGQSSSARQGGSRSRTVTLSVEAADGSMLGGTVRRDENGFVIADSSSKEYSMSELRALNLSDTELCIAWNEPFARQGYHFKNPGLRAYFQACDWYVDSGNDSSLLGVAAVNNERLREIAEEAESSRRWENLAAG